VKKVIAVKETAGGEGMNEIKKEIKTEKIGIMKWKRKKEGSREGS
jgi:hypothetical protein